MAAGHKTGFAEQDLPNAMKWNHFHRTVAPHAGAWIEIVVFDNNHNSIMSLPMRERGLKCFLGSIEHHTPMSLPMRERGLK